MSRTLPLAIAALVLAACTEGAPSTEELALGAECAGTSPGRACLTLRLRVTADARSHAPGDLRAPLAWAVYRGGDVDLFGPGDNKPVYEGAIADADMSAPDAVEEVNLPDVAPGSYQILAWLDDNANGTDDAGDPVTFPKDALEVRAERRIQVDVDLDYIR